MGGSAQLDDLYKLPPEAFTAARNALAKTLTGDAAKEARALKKPNAVAWSVNQLYWKARPMYDALMKSGHALREAQLGALKGKKSDVRAATEKHREALSRAVKRAEDIAHLSKVNPAADPLARMLDALSLMSERPDDEGRFVDVLQPSGFDALAGVKPVARPATKNEETKKRRDEEAEKLKKLAESRLDAAHEALRDARDKAAAVKRALNRAEADVADAERELEGAQAEMKRREG